jgi:hypothetical protein
MTHPQINKYLFNKANTNLNKSMVSILYRYLMVELDINYTRFKVKATSTTLPSRKASLKILPNPSVIEPKDLNITFNV